MAREILKIAPTKNNLLTLKRQAALLEEGHTLLERKRELLTRLVYDRIGSYRTLHKESREALRIAWRWLAITQMRMGSHAIQQTALGTGSALQVEILPRRALGVQYPSVQARRLPLKPVSLLGTDASLDQARHTLADAAVALARLSEAKIALGRLMSEQRKAQKLVNALRYNIIPRYQATIRYIRSILEEEERNTLFQIKVLRENEAKRLARKSAPAD